MSTAGLADSPLEIFSGYVPDIAPSDLPPGASPACQDVQFILGGWRTRPGTGTGAMPAPVAGNPTINYEKTFIDNSRNKRFLFLDSAGSVHQEFPQGTVTDGINTIPVLPNSYGKSATAYGREYIAFSDGQFGQSAPASWNGQTYDRVSQGGPGAAETVVDGAAGNIPAGVHQFSVFFILRTGYFTKPAPAGNYTAGGAKKGTVTNIPTGPPTVISRVLIFTTAAGAVFFFTTNASNSLANGNMVINDNVTTTLTVDFTDTILAGGSNATYLFSLIELEPSAGVVSYSTRLFWWGGRNLVPNFVNLSFDGGFGGTPASTNSGPNAPTAAVNDATFIGGTAWTNPGNVFVQDGVAASCAITVAAFNTQYIKATHFGFAIPLNATITGIAVIAVVKGSNSVDLTDNSVRLYRAGVLTGIDHANGNTWSTIFANQNYGSSVDLWGAAWTPADINDPNFGVAYAAQNNGSITRSVFVDFISVQVFFSTPAASSLPLGWTNGASSLGEGSALAGAFPVVWADAFSITGDGVTAKRGEINQSAFQDSLSNPILQPNTAYGVRAWVASAGGLANGTFHINLKSASGAFTTSGLAVQAGKTTAAYQVFTATLLTSALATVPTDLILQVYADGTPTNAGVFLVDDIEIYPLNQPFLNTTMRASLAGQPETYVGSTGVLQPFFQDGGTIRNAFVLREKLYILKDDRWYVTEDDGANEPSLWKVTQVSGAVGAAGPFASDVGEDWGIVANRSGPYLFWGGEPVKIGQEIQSDATQSGKVTWSSINWQFGFTIWVVIDKVNKRALIGAPVNAATSPNVIFYFDYRGLDTAQEIADHWSVKYSSYTGKILAIGNAPKWAPWNLSANSAALIERADGTTHTFLGNGAGTGKVYDLLDANKTDDGAGIPWSYQTYLAPGHQDELALKLGSHRKLFGHLTGSVKGSGAMSISIQPAGNTPATTYPPYQLVDPNVTAAIATIARVNGIVTVTTATPHGLTSGIDNQVIVTNAADASFSGMFPLLAVLNPNALQYAQPFLPDLILGAGGTAQRVWREFEITTNVLSERASYIFANSGNVAGSWCQQEKLVISLAPDPHSPVRGSVY